MSGRESYKSRGAGVVVVGTRERSEGSPAAALIC